MIKNISVLSLALVALINFEVKAQEQAQAEVGNPGSANMMMVEEGYVVESTTPQQTSPQEQNTDSATIVEQVTGIETPDSLDIEEDEIIMQND